ncbi:MAG: TolC family protein [bacterium]|nr:TolC family protein [bacterium]
MYRLILILTSALLTGLSLSAQSVLDQYVAEGLENNQQLFQEKLAVETTQLELSQAKGLYMPSVSFEASYTLANGGRGIQFPVGDLLNPVYGTLNQLTDSDQFPTIENVNEQFIPNDFHETKIRVVQPLMNSDIHYNKLIRESLVKVALASEETYKQELTKEIKVAYYSYLQAFEAIKIYNANEQSLKELVRFNQKRFEADQITKDEVYRSEFELQQLIADRSQIISSLETSKAYFNFLLNRSYDSEIEIDQSIILVEEMNDITIVSAISQRPEILQIKAAQEAQQLDVRRSNSDRFLPQINAVADLGYQGFGYEFSSDQDFWLVNLSLSWNIFSGFQKNQTTQISKIKLQALESQQRQLNSQISLEVVRAKSNFEASKNTYQAKQRAQLASQKNFDITNSRYRAGQALLVEYVDAQSSNISAQLDTALSKYQVLSNQAILDRSLAIK